MLNHEQQCTLNAMMNRIIPADDFPAAKQAGGPDYFLRQFQTDLRHLLPTYANGLESLDREATSTFGVAFVDLSEIQQDQLLKNLEAGAFATDWEDVDPAAFFEMVLHHTSEGYYSNSENGGNANSASWKMVGFDTKRI